MARKFIHHDKKQQTFCVCQSGLEERIDEEADVRIFDKCLDAVDISPILDKYSREGGTAFWPVILLKILVYGYSKGIQSSRKLAFAVRDSLSMKFLVGDINISHETIAFFRVRFRTELEEIFKDVVQLIYQITGTSVRLPFMDSVKLKASAADRRTKKKKDWQVDQEALSECVERHIAEYFSESIRVDAEEDETFGKKNSGFEILSARQELIFLNARAVLEERKKENNKRKLEKDREEIKKKLTRQNASEVPEVTSSTSDANPESLIPIDDNLEEKVPDDVQDREPTASHAMENDESFSEKEIGEIEKKLEANQPVDVDDIPETLEAKVAQVSKFLAIENMLEINKHADSGTFLNLTDPDARFVKINGQIRMGYNNQFTTNGQIPSSARATQQANDQNQFLRNIRAVQSNLPDHKIEGGIADAGYFNGKTLKDAEDSGLDAYIAPGRKKERNAATDPYAASNFTYNEDEDHWKCAERKTLEFHSDHVSNGKKTTTYKSAPGVCTVCPAFKQCMKTKEDEKRGYRTLTTDEHTIYRNDMINKMGTEEAKAIYKDRQIEPEPVFGNLKHNKRIRGFMVRGLDKVNGELQIIASCLSIGKLVSWVKTEGNGEKFLAVIEKRATA